MIVSPFSIFLLGGATQAQNRPGARCWTIASTVGQPRTLRCEEAGEGGLVEFKGRHSSGVCRASIYNAMPVEGVKQLTDFTLEFCEKDKEKKRKLPLRAIEEDGAALAGVPIESACTCTAEIDQIKVGIEDVCVAKIGTAEICFADLLRSAYVWSSKSSP